MTASTMYYTYLLVLHAVIDEARANLHGMYISSLSHPPSQEPDLSLSCLTAPVYAQLCAMKLVRLRKVCVSQVRKCVPI